MSYNIRNIVVLITKTKTMKKSIIYFLGICFILGCNQRPDNSSDKVLQRKTEKALSEATRQIGLPGIVNFQEKKLMKQIYELRDQENLICHAYLFNKMNGQIGQYLGKCIGYGLPYSTQFSNPIKTVRTNAHTGFIEQLPQSEPNGLFMPEGLSATWLLLIDKKTDKARPVYIEPEIIVSPFKLK